jgi:hypothetical protein
MLQVLRGVAAAAAAAVAIAEAAAVAAAAAVAPAKTQVRARAVLDNVRRPAAPPRDESDERRLRGGRAARRCM